MTTANAINNTASNISLTNITNQIVLGVTNTITLSSPAPSASWTYTLPDAGASANFIMSSILNGTIGVPQTITTGKLIVNYGVQAGANGAGNGFSSYASASNQGTLSLFAGNQGIGSNHSLTITNGVMGQATTFTLQDPGVNNVNFVLSAGSQTLAGNYTFSNEVAITPATNQIVLGTTNTTTISATAPAASRTYTIPDAGAAASFVLTTSALTNGQVLIGSTGLNPVASTLTPGAGISIANAAGSITISATDTISTQLQSIYYSTKGSDITGNGSIDNPYATVTQAVTHALTLTPTATNQVNVIGDPGTYTATGLKLYPNINFSSLGGQVFWTGTGNIVFNNSFSTTPSFITIKGITINSGLTLVADSSSLTNFNNTLTLADQFVAVTGPTFKAGASPQVYTLNIIDTVLIDTATTGTTFDSININAYGPHQISDTGATTFITTNNSLSLLSFGNIGMGNPSLTTSGSHDIIFQAYSGNVINITATANVNNSIELFRDGTTWEPNTIYAGSFASSTTDNNLSITNATEFSSLTFGATVNWDARSIFNGQIEMSGNATLANPTALQSGQYYTLIVTQDGTGGHTLAFSSNFSFPLGAPLVNTAANANTPFEFICVGSNKLICVSSGNPISALNVAGSIDLTNTTNQIILGTTNTTTISSVAPASSRTYTIRDALANVDILTSTYNFGAMNFQTSGSNAVNLGTGTYSGTITLGNASSANVQVAGNFSPVTAGGTNLGTTTIPFGQAILGSSSSNYIVINPASVTASRNYTMPDTGQDSSFVMNSTSDVVTTSQTIVRGSTYFANNASLVTFTLPSTASEGDIFRISGKGAGLFKIAQNASQVINFGTQATTTGTGGSITALNQYAVITVMCITSNTTWVVMNHEGNYTVT